MNKLLTIVALAAIGITGCQPSSSNNTGSATQNQGYGGTSQAPTSGGTTGSDTGTSGPTGSPSGTTNSGSTNR